MMAPSSGPHLALFAMWAAMMIGMMLPSAAPTLLIYGMVARRGDGAGDAPLRVHIFAGGYLVVWTVFSAVAALAQHAFTATDLLTPMMEARAPLATGANLGVIIGPKADRLPAPRKAHATHVAGRPLQRGGPAGRRPLHDACRPQTLERR